MRLSVALLILAVLGLGIGIGWWVHPGAGIAFASLLLGCVALLRDDGTTQEGRGR